MIKFSLILNSRLRKNLLSELLYSIALNTSCVEDIEVLISCDSDDLSTLIYSKSCQYKFAKFQFIQREANLHKRINKLANEAIGKYIFVLNDDCEILTPDWDIQTFKILELAKDGIIYGRTRDNSCDKGGDKKYASFPIISKKAVDVLGFFMHECFVGLGGDVGIYRVYNTINRVVDVPVYIDHKLHTTVERVVNADIVAEEMRKNTHIHYVDCFSVDITPDINRLEKYICENC